MIPPPQSEYFITEEMVQCIEAWTKKYPIVSKDIASVIRSRPYNSQSEREKVLVKLCNICPFLDERPETCENYVVEATRKELRKSDDRV
jgi:hypothetical protein